MPGNKLPRDMRKDIGVLGAMLEISAAHALRSQDDSVAAKAKELANRLVNTPPKEMPTEVSEKSKYARSKYVGSRIGAVVGLQLTEDFPSMCYFLDDCSRKNDAPCKKEYR